MQEQIEVWKKQYGDVYQVEVNDKTVYLKKPTRQVLAMAATKGKKDPFALTEIIITNCRIGGDELDLTDTGVLLGLSGQLDALLEEASVQVKKL